MAKLTVREGFVAHGYDGWSIHLTERPLWAVVGEQIYEFIWFNVLHDPCCKWKLPNWEWLQNVMFNMMQLPCKLFYPKGQGKVRHFPVYDEWVKENFPEIFNYEDDLCGEDDEPELKDPNHGTKCPVCGYGRVNDEPAKWIRETGKCFRCVVAEKITYQDPHA